MSCSRFRSCKSTLLEFQINHSVITIMSKVIVKSTRRIAFSIHHIHQKKTINAANIISIPCPIEEIQKNHTQILLVQVASIYPCAIEEDVHSNCIFMHYLNPPKAKKLRYLSIDKTNHKKLGTIKWKVKGVQLLIMSQIVCGTNCS